ERGVALYDALLEASTLRLRPILMTSIATIAGAIPLATSTGAGAEARSAIGWVIAGGVSLSTMMTLFVVPCLFLLLGRFTQPRSHIGEMLDALQQRFGSGHGPHSGHEGPTHGGPLPAPMPHPAPPPHAAPAE